MEKAIDTRTKLLTKNPFSLMLELSIPAILGMVVVGLYNMMDSIFHSKYSFYYIFNL